MAGPKYKQRCALCRKNMVLMYSGRQFPICTECDMKQIAEPVTDPAYKELLDLPPEWYERSSFLRSIKKSYLRYKALTEKQVEAFKKVVAEMKETTKEITKETKKGKAD